MGPICDSTVFYQRHGEFTNGMTEIRYSIRHIQPYKSDTQVEDFNSKICLKMSAYYHQLYNSV